MNKEIRMSNAVVVMREPKVSDLVMLDSIDGEMAKEVALISNLCELTQADVEALAYPEYKLLKKEVAAFLA